jgi:hypothetical protein
MAAEGRLSSRFLIAGDQVVLEIFCKCHEMPLGRIYRRPGAMRELLMYGLQVCDEMERRQREEFK